MRKMQSPSCGILNSFVAEAFALVELSHNSEVILILTDEGGLKTIPCT
jgi:hypothetical protein